MAYVPLALLLNERAEVCIELPRSPRSRAVAYSQLACAMVVIGRAQPDSDGHAADLGLSTSHPSGALSTAARQSRVRTSLALQRGGALGAMALVPEQRALAASLDRLLGAAMGVVQMDGTNRLREAEGQDMKRVCCALALCDHSAARETTALLDAFVERLVALLARAGSRADTRTVETLQVVVDHSMHYEERVLSLLGDAVQCAARQLAEDDARARALLLRADAECALALAHEAQETKPAADAKEECAAGTGIAIALHSTSELIDCTYVLLHTFEAIACAAHRCAAPRAAKRRRIDNAAAALGPSVRDAVGGAAAAYRARVRLAAGIALSFAGAFGSVLLIESYAASIYRRLFALLEHGAAERAEGPGDTLHKSGSR